jgi:hypothetical protein
MSDNFMGLGGIADRALLKSGMEALAIGFPLDGPVHDATLLSLKIMRHAQFIEHDPEYVTFLEQVQARYPGAYAKLAEKFARHASSRSMEVGEPPLSLMSPAG